MSYNWCHNPDCHTIETQSRVRGSGDNKVLRTVKIKSYGCCNTDSIWTYFCNNNCLHQFLNKFAREIANIRPVNKPSETPIKVEKTKYESHRYRWTTQGGSTREPYQATKTIISRVDND